MDPNNVPKTKRSEDDSVGKDVESCLRPRTRSSSNNDVLMVKSVLLPPCELIIIYFILALLSVSDFAAC